MHKSPWSLPMYWFSNTLCTPSINCDPGSGTRYCVITANISNIAQKFKINDSHKTPMKSCLFCNHKCACRWPNTNWMHSTVVTTFGYLVYMGGICKKKKNQTVMLRPAMGSVQGTWWWWTFTQQGGFNYLVDQGNQLIRYQDRASLGLITLKLAHQWPLDTLAWVLCTRHP